MKKAILVSVFISATCFLFNLSFAKDIYVDCNNIDGPWDGGQAHPFKAINDGVDVAFPGDNVLVMPGQCTLLASIDAISLPVGVSLIGSGTNLTTIVSNNNILSYTITLNGNNTISDLSIQGSQNWGVAVNGSDVVIDSNHIENFHVGIDVGSNGRIISNLEIVGNYIGYCNHDGIYLNYNSSQIDAFIYNNVITANQDYGIDIENRGGLITIRNNEITYAGSAGILAYPSDNAMIDLGSELDPGMNTFQNNGLSGPIKNGHPDLSINAQYNWWGQEEKGEEEPTGIAPGVIYEPWLPGPPTGPAIALWPSQSSYHSGEAATINLRLVNKEIESSSTQLVLSIDTWLGVFHLNKTLKPIPLTLPAGADGNFTLNFPVPGSGKFPYTTPFHFKGCLMSNDQLIDCGEATFTHIHP